MKPLRLLPPSFRWIGIGLLIAGVLIWLLDIALDLPWHTQVDLYYELIFICTVGGGGMAAFSSLHHEDEYMQTIRLQAWQWAVLLQVVIVVRVFFIPEPTSGPFSRGIKLEMTIYQMAGLFILYLLRFHYLLARTRRLDREDAA